MKNPSRNSFTLLELLLVVCILLILFSMMYPSFRKIRESSKRTVCLSNQCQLVRACHAYASSNRSYLPGNNGSFYTSFDLTESTWAAVSKVPSGMGLLISGNYLPSGKFFHCPSLDTKRAGISGHCMDLTQSNFWNGVGASQFSNPAYSTSRKISGYHYRQPSFVQKTGMQLRATTAGNIVISSDIVDGRFSSAVYGHREGYNRVMLDGSGLFYKDPSQVIFAMTNGLAVDGTTATDEPIFTKMAE
ncbi:MAG: Type secretion system protein precursor [Verrucomicrobiota bacterium]